MPYTVSLPLFEGPLDLLLHLIEKRELDVTRLSLAAVTDDYLQTIRQMQGVTPDGIADFLVVAARLLLIKSSLLLPRSEPEPAEEAEGEELARTLELYRQFKLVATELATREAEGLRAYPRTAEPPEMERRLGPNGTTLDDLWRALRQLLQEKEPEPENVDEVVRPLRITVRERIGTLTVALRAGHPLNFATLLSAEPSRQEVIATFLAMLECLKLGWLRVEQQGLWGQIALFPVPEALPEEESNRAATEIDEYI